MPMPGWAFRIMLNSFLDIIIRVVSIRALTVADLGIKCSTRYVVRNTSKVVYNQYRETKPV